MLHSESDRGQSHTRPIACWTAPHQTTLSGARSHQVCRCHGRSSIHRWRCIGVQPATHLTSDVVDALHMEEAVCCFLRGIDGDGICQRCGRDVFRTTNGMWFQNARSRFMPAAVVVIVVVAIKSHCLQPTTPHGSRRRRGLPAGGRKPGEGVRGRRSEPRWCRFRSRWTRRLRRHRCLPPWRPGRDPMKSPGRPILPHMANAVGTQPEGAKGA